MPPEPQISGGIDSRGRGAGSLARHACAAIPAASEWCFLWRGSPPGGIKVLDVLISMNLIRLSAWHALR